MDKQTMKTRTEFSPTLPAQESALPAPCPFCGETPTENAIEAHSHSMTIDGWKIPDHGGSHVIECACGAGLIADTREQVLAMWNRRATPPIQQGVVEALDLARAAMMTGLGMSPAINAVNAALASLRPPVEKP